METRRGNLISDMAYLILDDVMDVMVVRVGSIETSDDDFPMRD